MGILGWTAAVGALLLVMSMASSWIERGPITSFGIYLAAGVLVGPWALGLLHIDINDHALWLGRVTEVAMVVSLFITGLKLRLPFADPRWRVSLRLAFPAMLLTVAGVSLVAHLLTDLSWPLSLALAAMIAPTDPVLASLISVNDASDDDSLRVALSGEAGMNDGTALPFLLLALPLLAPGASLSAMLLTHWVVLTLLWSIAGGLGIGFGIGWLIGLLGARLKSAQNDGAPNDFLALALMALSYSAAQALLASGFLAAFAAGVGLRYAERRVVAQHPYPDAMNQDNGIHPPAEVLVNPNQRHAVTTAEPAASVGLVVSDALSFGNTIERMIAAGVVLLLGATFALHWQPIGVLLAAIIFVVIRPLSVYLATIGAAMPRTQRLMVGWLGIRGIGSINYLAYAFTHGLQGSQTGLISGLVLTVVVASVAVHGITVTPLVSWRQRRLNAKHAHVD